MKGITLEIVHPIEPVDARGENYELFKGKPGLQISLYHRHKGVQFGCHFHKGIDASKDPEYFYLIEGKVKMYARNGFTDEEETFEVVKGSVIIIEKGVYHEFEALTPVIFLEYRSTVFHKNNPDTFTEAEYNDYIRSFSSL